MLLKIMLKIIRNVNVVVFAESHVPVNLLVTSYVEQVNVHFAENEVTGFISAP